MANSKSVDIPMLNSTASEDNPNFEQMSLFNLRNKSKSSFFSLFLLSLIDPIVINPTIFSLVKMLDVLFTFELQIWTFLQNVFHERVKF